MAWPVSGWIRHSNENIIACLNRVRGPFNVNAAAQAAAAASLNDQEFVQDSIKINQEGKQYLYHLLRIWGWNISRPTAILLW